MEVIFATKNKGKIKEIQNLLGEKFSIKSLEEAGIDHDVEEDKETFEENALKKAKEIMHLTNEIVIADDSGLEIDFLNKEPGVNSARFMGQDTAYEIKNAEILRLLNGVEKSRRTARFVSVIVAAFPNGEVLTSRGVIEGFISEEIKGNKGFGYDPIFYVEEKQKTMAEMTLEEKNKISHRAKAFQEMKAKLSEKCDLK